MSRLTCHEVFHQLPGCVLVLGGRGNPCSYRRVARADARGTHLRGRDKARFCLDIIWCCEDHSSEPVTVTGDGQTLGLKNGGVIARTIGIRIKRRWPDMRFGEVYIPLDGLLSCGRCEVYL